MERKADENLMKFFKRLLVLKEEVKNYYEESKDEKINEIYKKLNEIIKER